MQRLRSLFIGVATLVVPAVQAKALTLEVKEAEVGEEHAKPAVFFLLTGQSARTFWEFSKLPKRVIFRVDGRDIMKNMDCSRAFRRQRCSCSRKCE
jgi:hypothetical protein